MVLSKEKIKNSFSRAAVTYDGAADFQKETGSGLLRRILSDPGPKDTILDLGMGTGVLTRTLSAALGTKVHGCDIAWGMVSIAGKDAHDLPVTQADMESLPYKDGSFDVIFSNIAHHWVIDFESSFLEIRRVLNKGGRFYFSILTKDSLKELYKTLKESLGEGQGEDFFPGRRFIHSSLERAGLNILWTEEQALKRYYPSAMDLIKRLKAIGANRISDANNFKMGQRKLLYRITEMYDRKFSDNGGVYATYNVTMGCAKKP